VLARGASLTVLAALLLTTLSSQEGPRLQGDWAAALTTPGGPLAFELAFEPRADGREGVRAFLVNGEERIEVPRVAFDGRELLLDMPHYDSRIRARLQGGRLAGTWEKRRGAERSATLPFEAVAPAPERTPGADAAFLGRWRVDFESEEEDAIAAFHRGPRGLRGTFLTVTGDYRYLEGATRADELTLSCFDGAHAFLFRAREQADGSLAGDFWSGDWHHETWTAVRDDRAALPDAFAQTRWDGRTKLGDLRFPDLDGTERALADFAGKATLLVVLGSWCPNCHDEARLLAELDARYRERGLRILGLAFELTGDFARDAGQVRIFAARHGLAFPFFLCGTADKEAATRALGLVDRVRAFPTTVFVGADGLPRAVHSGFSGPATGEEHLKLRREFERRIEGLLADLR
jgi:thiol-disulfide isomerase/thioredoxin